MSELRYVMKTGYGILGLGAYVVAMLIGYILYGLGSVLLIAVLSIAIECRNYEWAKVTEMMVDASRNELKGYTYDEDAEFVAAANGNRYSG